MDCCDNESLLERFREKHARERSLAAKKLERAVLGREVGLNGYTTVDQAESLSKILGASSDDWLLEVGAGCGWPGWYLARITGCRLVAVDVPLGAMIQARVRFASHLSRGTAHAIVSDGVTLGIASASMDGVIHADMLCCVLDKLAVLRESLRVLKPTGRMVGYLIHTPSRLNAAGKERASDLGPSAVNADYPPEELASRVGFTVLDVVDVTGAFRDTVSAIIGARVELEDELRREEGDAVYEEELRDEQDMVMGIDEGLLLRSLLVLAKGA